MKIIDISIPLQEDMPIWPGTASMKLIQMQSLISGDQFNLSRLDIDVHTGTHVDAPKHYLENGMTVDQLSLEILIGPAMVAHLPNENSISASDLDKLNLPEDTERLLLRTKNSQFWTDGIAKFKRDYAAFTADAARWIINHGIRLIGIDYLSVQMFDDAPIVHKVLLGAGVIVLESLNLADVDPGAYDLLCLPLKLVNAEGAPARAVLLKH